MCINAFQPFAKYYVIVKLSIKNITLFQFKANKILFGEYKVLYIYVLV